MMFLFLMLFLLAIGKKYWKQHRNGIIGILISGAIEKVLTAKPTQVSGGDGVSRARREVSGSLHIPYTYNGNNYEVVIPPQKTRVKWTQGFVEATEDSGMVDFTSELKSMAGPYGNFLNIDYQPGHLVQGCHRIVIMNGTSLVREFEHAIEGAGTNIERKNIEPVD